MSKKTKVVIENGEEKRQGLLSLFAKQEKIYQARVRGKWRTLKWAIMYPLLSFYYILPWVRWDRGEGSPDQAVMFDTINRKFYFFFIEIWPQEVYLFTALLLLAALSLFFVTSIAGRVWCGYACPQTVWTDLFFIIERRIEGNRNARKKFDEAPWTWNKIWRKSLKHFIWIVIALCTGGAWVFYFTDAPTLWQNILAWDIPFVAGFWICLLTLSTYTLAGFAREQVCTYMCPYARFQGAMFDNDTLLVSYDEKRGEPRGKAGEGDCIDCGRCVAVCPTGIDIRNGQQYQCINCALCVDACNAVMDKIDKPRGLIRYNSMNNTIRKDRGVMEIASRLRIVRPRTVFYATVILIVMSAILYSLTSGKRYLELNVIRDRNPLYIQLQDGSIRNAYTLHVVNKISSEATYTLSVEGLDGANMRVPRYNMNADGTFRIVVKPGKVASFRILVEAPKNLHKGQVPFTFKASNDTFKDVYKTVFIAPKR